MKKEKKEKKEKDSFFQKQLRKFGLKKRIYIFVENLNALLGAGVDISTALGIILEEEDNSRMKKITKKIKTDIDNGNSLTKSLTELGILPGHMMAFVSLGEKSGKLSDNLKILVLQNQKETLFRSKIRSALLYAVIVVFMATAVALGTGWYTLPKIAEAYGKFGSDLPALTRGIMFLGKFMWKYGYIVAPLGVLSVLASFYFFFSFPKTRFIGDWFLMKIPLIRGLIIRVEVARFSYLLGTMLEAGLPIKDSLEAMPEISSFKNFKKFYTHIYEDISNGKTFKYSINDYPKSKKLFPAGVRQMIAAAEASGTLSSTLLRIGQMYENKVEVRAKNLPVIIEPILLVIIGIGVAIFILGTVMPIYNLINVI